MHLCATNGVPTHITKASQEYPWAAEMMRVRFVVSMGCRDESAVCLLTQVIHLVPLMFVLYIIMFDHPAEFLKHFAKFSPI
ncbi:hypothetical protein YC2023_023068 [Brassica napus]